MRNYNTTSVARIREKKRTVYIILCAIAVMLMMFILTQGKNMMGDFRKLIDNSGNKEYGKLENDVITLPDAKPLRCIISSAPTFKTSSSMGSYKILNSEDNDGLILQVTITDKETGDIVYLSPPLQPGEKVEEDYLVNKGAEYDKGEHKAVATFSFFDQETNGLYYEVPIGVSINILG